jgi:hypothetical protein
MDGHRWDAVMGYCGHGCCNRPTCFGAFRGVEKVTRLSEHFTAEEMGLKDAPRVACYLYQRLTEDILEPIRAFLGCQLRVTSGYRTEEDVTRLTAAGYNPSETSDHSAGTPVVVRTPAKIQTHGRWFWASTGAADIVPMFPGGAEKAFNLLLGKADRETGRLVLDPFSAIQIGQLIFERSKTGAWLHISNPRSALLSSGAIGCFPKRTPFLVSTANGAPGSYREP